MASIKGIALKAVKTFTTWDGVGFTANLYMDNKKIGFAQDAGQGGEVEFHILKPEHREEFSRRVREYYDENPAYYHSEHDFIDELYQLWETEKAFKNYSKRGFPITIHMAFHKRNDNMEEVFDQGYKPDIMMGVKNEEVAQAEIEKRKPAEYTIYRTLEDFVIS